MRDWDRLLALLIGLGVAGRSGYVGWKSWQNRQPGAAAGSFLLSMLCVAGPLVLVIIGR